MAKRTYPKDYDYHVPSFFEKSKIDDERYIFDNTGKHEEHNRFLKESNMFVDYESTNHVRIMKRFKPVIPPMSDKRIAAFWEKDMQNEFYIRCYLPKQRIAVQDHQPKLDHVIIMINGLDEFHDYDLYDSLGSSFANAGYSSILLPTPYHLNRRIADATGKILKPSDYVFDQDLDRMYFYNFWRSKHEVESLMQQLRGSNWGDADRNFYRTYFYAENLKISLFGFSLGGVKALGSMLKLKNINSCIVFNGAIGLNKSNFMDVSSQSYQIVDSIEKAKAFLDGDNQLNDEEIDMAMVYNWLCFVPRTEWFRHEMLYISATPLKEKFETELGQHSKNNLAIEDFGEVYRKGLKSLEVQLAEWNAQYLEIRNQMRVLKVKKNSHQKQSLERKQLDEAFGKIVEKLEAAKRLHIDLYTLRREWFIYLYDHCCQAELQQSESTAAELRRQMERISSRCLFVQSAADQAVSLEMLNHIIPKSGLHQVIVPEVKHVPKYDTKWGDWLPKISEYMVRFLADELTISRQALLWEIGAILEGLRRKPNRNPDSFDFLNEIRVTIHSSAEPIQKVYNEKKIKQPVNADFERRFMELFFMSQAYYPKFSLCMEEVLRLAKLK